MLGTDARELLLPALNDLIPRVVAPGGHVLDLGGGDGRTLALMAKRLPDRTTVSVVEPNPGHIVEYRTRLSTHANLVPGAVLERGLEELDEASGVLPDGAMSLVLGIHMLYFFDDPAAGLARMARFLGPGGALCVVATAGVHGYTEQLLRAFVARVPGATEMARRLAAAEEREALLCGGIRALLAGCFPGERFECHTQLQPSRYYGHSLADVIALAGIAELAQVPARDRFEAAADLLRSAPQAVDLRIEDDGPRTGMWSVAQPQHVVIVRRPPVR